MYDGVEHQLPGIVGGGPAAPADLHEVDSPPGQLLFVRQQFVGTLAGPQRNDRRMLYNQHGIADFAGSPLLLQPLLQRQHLAILGHAAISDNQIVRFFHGELHRSIIPEIHACCTHRFGPTFCRLDTRQGNRYDFFQWAAENGLPRH